MSRRERRIRAALDAHADLAHVGRRDDDAGDEIALALGGSESLEDAARRR
jgi:hypothetical protein